MVGYPTAPPRWGTTNFTETQNRAMSLKGLNTKSKIKEINDSAQETRSKSIDKEKRKIMQMWSVVVQKLFYFEKKDSLRIKQSFL